MTYRHFHPQPIMFLTQFMYLVYDLMTLDTFHQNEMSVGHADSAVRQTGGRG